MNQLVTRSLSDRFARRTQVFGDSIWTDIFRMKELHADPVYFGDGAPAREMLPLDRMREANQLAWEEAAMGYGDQKGYAPLREWIVNHLSARDIQADAENVIITGGSTQALDIACRVLLEPGDAVIVENPTFLGALEIFETFEAEVIGVDCDDDGMLMESLEAALEANPHAKIVYTIPTFQNPTGTTLPLDRRQRMVELAERFNVAIFEDDPYGDLQYSGEGVAPIRSLSEDVVYFGTFSKTLAPGIRVGYVIAPEAVTTAILATREVSDISNDRVMMRTVYHALADNYLKQHIAECRDFYRARRDAMLVALEKHMPESVHWSKPDGGFFVWITMPDNIDGDELFRVAAEHGTVVFPGKWFDPAGEVGHTVRLSFSTVAEDRIELGISRLADAVRSLL